jgi:hypothetical protein
MDSLMNFIMGSSPRERTLNIVLLMGSAVALLLLSITSIIDIIVHQDLVQQTILQSTQVSNAATNAYPAYLPGSGTLLIADPLQQEKYWQADVNQDFGGSCQFEDGALHVREEKPHRNYSCYSFLQSFTNFAFEVQMTIIQGECGSVNVSIAPSSQMFYYVEICLDGTCRLVKYLDDTGKNTFLLAKRSHRAIRLGLNQTNLLAIYVNRDILRVFANGQQIMVAQDGDGTMGAIQLSAVDITSATEVVYQQARVWTLN